LESSELARFEAVVSLHLDAAYTVARYLTRNEHEAEDVVQDACLRALKSPQPSVDRHAASSSHR